MSDNHQHAAEQAAQQQMSQRRPGDARIITRLNMSLDQRAGEIRMLQDQLTFAQADADELADVNAGLTAALDQITAENRMLRARCGLPEAGAIELTDAEADGLPSEMVAEVPEPGDKAVEAEAPPVEAPAAEELTDEDRAG